MPALRLAEHARILFWIWVSLWSVVLIWGIAIVRKLAQLASGERLIQRKTEDLGLFLQFILWIGLSLLLLLKW